MLAALAWAGSLGHVFPGGLARCLHLVPSLSSKFFSTFATNCAIMLSKHTRQSMGYGRGHVIRESGEALCNM
jgi:hypothetical protein